MAKIGKRLRKANATVDRNAFLPLDAAMRMVEGSARSMGLEVTE